jgi:malic enzyme
MQFSAGEEKAPHGAEIFGHPLINKDAGFTAKERDEFGLRGLLPWRVATLAEQVTLELEHLRGKASAMEKYIGLMALQDRNETLFYRLLSDHLEELAPIVYTPTVGEACERFSHILRRPRGLWITPEDIAFIPEMLRHAGRTHVSLIVVTDGERILGLGDQGAGGMGIPVGKLSLYTAGAGINPARTLPICLDCGTDNEDLQHDPLYLGYPKRRLRGAGYDAFVGAFVRAVRDTFPGAVLQWEDFKQHNAIRLLDLYRHTLPSFNDDIQGTAVVVLAGILAAVRSLGGSLRDQRLVLAGAGAAGIGIARLVGQAMRADGASARDVRTQIVLTDSLGLVFEDRAQLDADKRAFALSASDVARYGFAAARKYDLETVIRQVEPSILIGTTGRAGTFPEGAIRAMAAATPEPVIFPLSNPTSHTEAAPADLLAWTDGRALVATGSPFDPVRVGDRYRVISQANNLYTFPGIGLGTIAVQARGITDAMLLAAARTLAGLVSTERLAEGALYPPLAGLRAISRAVAAAVAGEAQRSGLAQMAPRQEPEAAVDAAIWTPAY